MKATIEIPDELYRRVKAKSALEGRPVRAVTEDLFRRYVIGETSMPVVATESGTKVDGAEDPVPVWFGALGKYAHRVDDHSMDAIRASIAKGIVRERDL